MLSSYWLLAIVLATLHKSVSSCNFLPKTFVRINIIKPIVEVKEVVLSPFKGETVQLREVKYLCKSHTEFEFEPRYV